MANRLTWENFQGEYFEAGDKWGSGEGNGDGTLDNYDCGNLGYGLDKDAADIEDGWGCGENGLTLEHLMLDWRVDTSFVRIDPPHPNKTAFVSYLNNLIAEAEKLKYEQEIVLVEQIKNTFISMFGDK